MKCRIIIIFWIHQYDGIKFVWYILHRYLIPTDDEQSKIPFQCCQQQSQKVFLRIRFLPFKSNPDRNLIFNSRQAEQCKSYNFIYVILKVSYPTANFDSVSTSPHSYIALSDFT